MHKKLLLLGMASVFTLTGCHGTKKVDYETFSKEVQTAAETQNDFTAVSVKVSGKIENERFKTFTVDIKSKSEPELDDKQKKAYALGVTSSTVYQFVLALELAKTTIGEKVFEPLTFYVGNGFKVKSSGNENSAKGKFEFDKKGLLVRLVQEKEGKKTDMSLSWKTEKSEK